MSESGKEAQPLTMKESSALGRAIIDQIAAGNTKADTFKQKVYESLEADGLSKDNPGISRIVDKSAEILGKYDFEDQGSRLKNVRAATHEIRRELAEARQAGLSERRAERQEKWASARQNSFNNASGAAPQENRLKPTHQPKSLRERLGEEGFKDLNRQIKPQNSDPEVIAAQKRAGAGISLNNIQRMGPELYASDPSKWEGKMKEWKDAGGLSENQSKTLALGLKGAIDSDYRHATSELSKIEQAYRTGNLEVIARAIEVKPDEVISEKYRNILNDFSEKRQQLMEGKDTAAMEARKQAHALLESGNVSMKEGTDGFSFDEKGLRNQNREMAEIMRFHAYSSSLLESKKVPPQLGTISKFDGQGKEYPEGKIEGQFKGFLRDRWDQETKTFKEGSLEELKQLTSGLIDKAAEDSPPAPSAIKDLNDQTKAALQEANGDIKSVMNESLKAVIPGADLDAVSPSSRKMDTGPSS